MFGWIIGGIIAFIALIIIIRQINTSRTSNNYGRFADILANIRKKFNDVCKKINENGC